MLKEAFRKSSVFGTFHRARMGETGRQFTPSNSAQPVPQRPKLQSVHASAPGVSALKKSDRFFLVLSVHETLNTENQDVARPRANGAAEQHKPHYKPILPILRGRVG
jgi:hypothetical protein